MESEFSLQALTDQLAALEKNFSAILQRVQTGRAHPSLLDGLSVEVNHAQLPLNQVSTILALEAKTLQVTPFDPQNINLICEAISGNQELNLNPTDDGRVIYVPIPPLTTERRQQIVKGLESQKEDFLVKLRQLRHHYLKQIKQTVSGEDRIARHGKEVETAVTKSKQQLEDSAQAKENEILNMDSQ